MCATTSSAASSGQAAQRASNLWQLRIDEGSLDNNTLELREITRIAQTQFGLCGPLRSVFHLWLSTVLIGPKESFRAGKEAQRGADHAKLREIEERLA